MYSGRSEHDAYDEPVKSDSLSEDHHKDHSNQNVAVLESVDTCLTNNTNAHTRCHAGETDGKTSCQVLPALEPVVAPLVRIDEVLWRGVLNC